MIFRNKRSELEIVCQILDLAQHDITKTQLMYQTYLCYTHFMEYFHFLLNKQLLGMKQGNPVGKVYFTTEKGRKLLGDMARVITELKAES